MKIRIKTRWFELYSDTTRHQLLLLAFLSVLWIQFYAFAAHVDSQIWATTSSVIMAIVAYCTGIEYKSLKLKAKRGEKVG